MSLMERLQGWVPKSPPVENNKRVYWVDLMRIIGCIAVPIVHSINFTGTAGQPDPKHLGAFHCGYDARDPAQLHGRHYTPAHSPESVRLEQYLERRYMSSMAIFFFASGAALYYSLRSVRSESFWPKLISRNKYLMLLLLFGMVTCVVPVNMIWHGARTVHDAIFVVNPFYHLGFLITLVVFTLMVTPLCWAIVRESVYGWICWFMEIFLMFAVYIALRSTPMALSSEVCGMVVLNTINLAWTLVSSYYVNLRELRAPIATLLHIATFAIPNHFRDIWAMREAKAGNAITTMYLIMLLYLVPFVLGMLAEAFPTERGPNRAYVKYYSAVLLYMVFSYWTEPVGSKGWMEAYSIRMFDGRGDRVMYMANMWATVWFLYEVLKVFPDCPYPDALAQLNRYSLILYVYHPLFLSFTTCYVVAYMTSVPCILETAMLYFSALGGCYLLFFSMYQGGPWAKKLYRERVAQRKEGDGGDEHESRPLLGEV